MSLPKIKIVDLSDLESIDSLLSLIRDEDDIILKDHGVEIAKIFPRRAPQPLLVPAPTESDLERFRNAAGGWAGLGVDDMVDELYRNREQSAKLDVERHRRLFPDE